MGDCSKASGSPLKSMLRIFSFFIICASIFLFPWWVASILVLVAVFYFDLYVEGIFFAIVLDALYGYGTGAHRFLFMVCAILFLLLVPLVKSKLHMRS
jgi:hypothetical protein